MGFEHVVEPEKGVLLVLWAGAALTCMAAVVQEETVRSCNTPCDMAQLTCPPGHRMAIRDALFSVTSRPSTSGPCSVTHTCGDETMCCEESPTQDCVFAYSHSHLEAVHRNCSGTRACFVQTARSQEETVSCPFFKPEETVSHTVLDYVCINDSATINICEARETVREGRTLFTMLDSRRWRDPIGGAVCRCTAESVRWPTTNTIAVFVVDMRLNVLRQSQCSKADVTLKSGSTTRHLDCVSSQDPRQSFPFIALLNHSNVATVELLLHSQLPEFVWIGFESNELEDIRLSCGLQGYKPIFPNDDDENKDEGAAQNGAKNLEKGKRDMPVGAISGGVVGVIVVCVAVVTIVILIVIYRRRRQEVKPDDYSEPRDLIDDIDVYYSTPDLPASAVASNNNSSKIKNTVKTQRTTADITDDGDMYVTAQIVRERKHQSGKKKVRILSTPDISDDVAEYYSSPWDIRDRRRMEELCDERADYVEDDVFEKVPDLPPKSQDPLPLPPDADEGEDYAVFERNRPKGHHVDDAEESYDHLAVLQKNPDRKAEGKTIPDDDIVTTECDNFSIVNDDRQEPDGCNQNPAFENDDTVRR